MDLPRLRAVAAALFLATAMHSFAQPPASPLTITSFSATAISTQEVVLFWNPNPAADGFLIERSPVTSTLWSTITSTGADAISAKDATVTPGESYQYRLTPTLTEGTPSPGATTTVTVPPRDLLAGGLLSGNALDLWSIGFVGALARQSDGKWIVGGSFTNVNGIPRHGIARLNADGTLDETFLPGTGPRTVVRSIAIQADGKVVVAGNLFFGGTLSRPIARVLPSGDLDTSFGVFISPSNNIFSLLIRPDGRIIVGRSGTSTSALVRLNPDGSISSSFSPFLTGARLPNQVTVWALAQQGDGKILVGGDFRAADSINTSLVRILPNGAIDTSFAPVPLPYSGFGTPPSILALAIQPDGKILLGGRFAPIATGSTANFTRLNSDGLVDSTFNLGTGPNDLVNTISVLSDGRIGAGGSFTTFANAPRSGFAIVEPNGALSGGASIQLPSVGVVAAAPGGQCLVAGSFSVVNGQKRTNFASFLADGVTPDPLFQATVSRPGYASAFAAQPDGKIIVAGTFTSVGGPDPIGSPRHNVLRLAADGSLDPQFGTVPSLFLWANGAAVAPDGRVWFRGSTGFGPSGALPPYLARLNGDGSPDSGALPQPNASVTAILPEPDGGAIISGVFSQIGTEPRFGLARLTSDGSVSPDLAGALEDGFANPYRQPDGMLLFGGSFTSLFGQPRRNLVRIGAGYMVDESFHPMPDGPVSRVFARPDGRIWVNGTFTTIGGASRPGLARLLSTGQNDHTFIPPTSVTLLDVAEENGIIAGPFTHLAPGRTLHVARLAPNGSFDRSFDVGIQPDFTPLLGLAVGQTILFGGSFTTFGGQPRYGLARVRAVAAQAPPTSPAPLLLAGTTTDSASLGWAAAGGSTGYLIERRTPGASAWQVVGVRTASATSFDDTGLPTGSAWKYRVTAFNTAGLSPASNVVPVSLPTTFAQWRLAWQIDPAATPAGDPDGDGLALLAEYATGLSPAQHDADAAATAESHAGRLYLTYFRARTDVAYVVEASTDLAIWDSIGVDQGDAGPWVSASVPIGGEGARFLRLRITLLP